MTNVRWVQYKKYAGCKIAGAVGVPAPTSNLHIERAYYLTAMLEAPKYGSIQSYDGAGMSGGPLHNIAVYPKSMTQGSLFPLLRALEVSAHGSGALQELFAEYQRTGWFVAKDGKLRSYSSGSVISGTEIRDTFTPVKGAVPKSGTRWDAAKKWAVLHHKVFSDPLTFHGQKEFAINYLVSTQASYEAAYYGTISPLAVRVMSSDTSQTGVVTDPVVITPEEDLAMCVYHSHSVNGPAPARTILTQTLKHEKRGSVFAKRLIHALGRKQYGRWEDTVDGANRYDRTRHFAAKAGLWPKHFFTGPKAIMPENLPK